MNHIIRERLSSQEIVPGDIIEIPEPGIIVPCDMILIQGKRKDDLGSAVMNESILSGETNPIIKMPTSLQNLKNLDLVKSNHMIYYGTKVIQCSKNPGEEALAFVVRTGFTTVKGQMINSILNPKQILNKFEKDSIKYIFVMGAISILSFLISSYFLFNKGVTIGEILMRSLDLITITVPPALPACISIGISHAIATLKEKSISCIDREKVNNAGRVNVLCFDKTGTLTEETLEVYGLMPTRYEKGSFLFNGTLKSITTESELVYNSFKSENHIEKDIIMITQAIDCISTCNLVLKSNEGLHGDPLEIKLLEFTGYLSAKSPNEKVFFT